VPRFAQIFVDFLGSHSNQNRVDVPLPAMYFRKKTSGGRAYLQIVECRREGAVVRQQVIATLGRIEDLQASGQLERLLRSGARFADKAIVLDALERGEATTGSTRRIGPALAFERVWEETGCRGVIERLARARKHDFLLERAAFLTVLHRLFCVGSSSRRRRLARGLSHRRRRGHRAASPLSRRGVVREELRGRAGRRDAVCAALREGRSGRGVVRLPA
jgi:hypothetical protein